MAQPKYNFDTGEWDMQQDPYADSYAPGEPQPQNHDVSGIKGAPDYNGQTSQAPVGNIDRGAFQKDWMSSNGTFDDFMASHPQYKGQVTPHNGSKDVYDLKGTNETLDLVGDVGGANKHNWTGTGMGQNGQVDVGGPAANPAFGNINDFMSSNGFGGGSSSSKGPAFGDMNGLTEALKGLFPGGAFNQGIVDARTNLASDDLNRARKSRLATNRATLADRGTLGSGPEITANNRMDEGLYNTYANAVRGINADESQNADSRMIQALQVAAGMTAEQAKSLIDQFRAQTERSLGEGNLALGGQRASNDYSLGLGGLALGNMNGVNNYNLGLANYGLDRDKTLLNQGNLSQEEIDKILSEYLSGSSQTQAGRR